MDVVAELLQFPDQEEVQDGADADDGTELTDVLPGGGDGGEQDIGAEP